MPSIESETTYHITERTTCAICHGAGSADGGDTACYTCAGHGYYEILVPLDNVPLVQDILSELAALRRLTGLIQDEL